ncbi:hypothetical protein HanIR_Chr10g0453231 [Helianthus annuus]|nr:hypothetical protein HanIR_Chr10g0453231 [Helianthus annuus]
MDDDYVDVSSILTNSDSDGMSDEEDIEVSDSEEDKKVDPDYHPIEFEWNVLMPMLLKHPELT